MQKHFSEAGFVVCKYPLVVVLQNLPPTRNNVQFFANQTEFATAFHCGGIAHLTNEDSKVRKGNGFKNVLYGTKPEKKEVR